MEEITIIIKTFMRKDCLVKLLKSIRKSEYKDFPILIYDDSKEPYAKFIENMFSDLNIDYIIGKFDSGLSKGRNILIKNVKTKYFLLCDDDFEFSNETKIKNLLKILEKLKEVSIIGGGIKNYFKISRNNNIFLNLKNIIKNLKNFIIPIEVEQFYGKIRIKENILYTDVYNILKEEYKIVDFCLNFFLAKTEDIKQINGWDERLKIGEHTEFFINCKLNNLKVAVTNSCIINHYPERNSKYKKFRNRNNEFDLITFKKYDLKKWIAIQHDKKLLLEFEIINGDIITKKI